MVLSNHYLQSLCTRDVFILNMLAELDTAILIAESAVERAAEKKPNAIIPPRKGGKRGIYDTIESTPLFAIPREIKPTIIA